MAFNSEETDLLSKQAEVFRSKLIADFHLLESINEGGTRVEAPRYYTSDVLEDDKMAEMMTRHPNGLVRFQVYHNNQAVSSADRRKNRLKNKNSKHPPLDLWAHWVVKSAAFQNLILALILINSVVLGIQAEVSDRQDPRLEPLKLSMDIFDYCSLVIFIVEIILKWIDHFKNFWKNNWNIFDFLVTFLSLVPEIISLSTGTFGKRHDAAAGSTTSDLAVVATNMRTFRVLRSLKMVSRFQKVRLIVLAVTKAFQAMVFITVLLFIFAYIFAIMGVIFFSQGYEQAVAEGVNLKYNNSFSSIVQALITLFQLLTLDHWFHIYKDATRVGNYMFSAFYIILWILIGSYIFRNIFVGIMVNNFQSIRNDLFQEVKGIQDKEKRDVEMGQFAEELDRQNNQRRNSAMVLAVKSQHRASIVPGLTVKDEDIGTDLFRRSSRFASKDELKEAHSAHIAKTERDGVEWQEIVEKNLENLAKEETMFCWPKDSLFRYFVMMENLMENLKERQDILGFMGEALTQIHDT